MNDTPQVIDPRAILRRSDEHGLEAFAYWGAYERLERENAELRAALRELVDRCDGLEGVRADGSNIQTIRAHAVLEKLEAA